MKMPRRRVFAAIALGGLLTIGSPIPQAAEPPVAPPAAPLGEKEAAKWMQRKLHTSQEILAGLTSGDLKSVENEARRLMVFNLLENWLRDNPLANKSGYQGQLNAFEFATKELVRNSETGNVDGALEAYIGLTRSCVECHKLIRDVPKMP